MNNGYQIILRKKDSKIFWKYFELLSINYEYIGAKFDPIVLDYYFVRAEDSNYLIEDLSCIFTYNNIPYSAFIGAPFTKMGKTELSLFEIPCLAIDSPDLSQSQKKQINIYLDSLYLLDFSTFKIKGPDFNNKLPAICELLLSKPSSKLKLSFSRIIDLKKEIGVLKKMIRKSYHSLINWGFRELNIEIYDKNNISWDTLEEFRKLHIEASGKETRSIRTWKKQFEAIKSGLSFCITAKLDKELVSASYFICSKNICYYGSSASKRSLFDKPLSHSIIWQAVLESKKRGILLFDMGVTNFCEDEKFLSNKEKNIAYFKDGFGGRLTLNYLIESKKNSNYI